MTHITESIQEGSAVQTITAYVQNGRNVTYAEVTTEDLIVDASRRKPSSYRELARAELSRRGINWTVYV